MSHSELESYLYEILEKYHKLQDKYKGLKQVKVSESEAHNKLKKDFSNLNEENFILKNEKISLQSKSSKLEKEILSEASVDSENVIVVAQNLPSFFYSILLAYDFVH